VREHPQEVFATGKIGTKTDFPNAAKADKKHKSLINKEKPKTADLRRAAFCAQI